jgi:hypothetical protein
MSMNVLFGMTRKIIIISTGKEDIQTAEFENDWQTPTDVSYSIAEAEDPVQAYKDYLLSIAEGYDYKQIEYDDKVEANRWLFSGDSTAMNQPAHHFIKGNRILDHIENFDAWIESCRKCGYDKVVVRVI